MVVATGGGAKGFDRRCWLNSRCRTSRSSNGRRWNSTGLNAVTGETGAGKSLLVDALELLLGRRPGLPWCARAPTGRVEGRFVLPLDDYGAPVGRWLAEHLPEALEEREQEDELEPSRPEPSAVMGGRGPTSTTGR